MFDYEYDDAAGDHGIDELIAAYEASATEGGRAYFDSEDLEHIATFYFERGRLDDALAVVDRQLEQAPGSSDPWMRLYLSVAMRACNTRKRWRWSPTVPAHN